MLVTVPYSLKFYSQKTRFSISCVAKFYRTGMYLYRENTMLLWAIHTL